MTRRFSQTARRQQVRGEYPSCPTFAVFGSPPSGSTPAAYHVAHEREMTVGVAEAMLPRSVAIMLHCRTRPPVHIKPCKCAIKNDWPIRRAPDSGASRAHLACDACRQHADPAKHRTDRRDPLPVRAGAQRSTGSIVGSIVAFQMHDKFNEPHRHECQCDKYANDVDPTELPTCLPTYLRCHFVAVLRRRSLNR